MKKTREEFGKIDILVNNVGVFYGGKFLDTSSRRWDMLMAINLRSMFLCTRAVLPYMLEQNWGSLINLSSFLARAIDVERASIVYGVTKAGVERFTLGLAHELKDTNIAVNAFAPRFVLTEGAKIFFPNEDFSGWQSPEMWGKYAVLVAAQEPQTFTGRVLSEEDLRKEFGPV